MQGSRFSPKDCNDRLRCRFLDSHASFPLFSLSMKCTHPPQSYTICYRISNDESRNQVLVGGAISIFKLNDEQRSFFYGLITETERRFQFSTCSLDITGHSPVVFSRLPQLCINSLHSFHGCSQPLYQVLGLEDILCDLGRNRGPICPSCACQANTFTPDEMVADIAKEYLGQKVCITVPFQSEGLNARQLFSAIVVDGNRWDTLDLNDSGLASPASCAGIIFEGTIQREIGKLSSAVISALHELRSSGIQVRNSSAPFPVSRHYGTSPTCPKCGISTLPLTPGRLRILAKDIALYENTHQLSWYPEVRHLLTEPIKTLFNSAPNHSPVLTEIGNILLEFGLSGTLATPISNLSLSERLCMRFLVASRSDNEILAIELPDYGLSQVQMIALKNWCSRETSKGRAIVSLGGERSLGNDLEAEAIPQDNALTHPSHILSAEPGDTPTQPLFTTNREFFGFLANLSAASTISLSTNEMDTAWSALLSDSDEGEWKRIDLVRILCDRPPSASPMILLLPLYRALTSLYAQVTAAKSIGIGARELSLLGGKSHRCEHCSGRGRLREDRLSVICPACSGSRFQPHIEMLTFRGIPFPAIFTQTARDILSHFSAISPITRASSELCQMGLGDITLGTPEKDLHPENRMRLHLLKECSALPRSSRCMIRGIAGLLNKKEQLSIRGYLSDIASARSHSIIHDCCP